MVVIPRPRMKRSARSEAGVLVVLLAIAVAFSFFAVFNMAVSATTISVPGDYPKIQDAVDNATAGDTIEVSGDVYYERVRVTKQLTLMGKGWPVVDAGNAGIGISLEKWADGIWLEGFNVTNAWEGIAVYSMNNIITGNIATSNKKKGLSYGGNGIYIDYSSGNTITNNVVTSNEGSGICLHLEWGDDVITNNVIRNNAASGIYLGSVLGNCNLTNNTVSSNYYGISLSNANKNNIIGNTITLNKLEGIRLFASSNNTLTGNTVKSNNVGIVLVHKSNFNKIITNKILDNSVYGIELTKFTQTLSGLQGNTNNIIERNKISHNTYGIGAYHSHNNTIRDNDLTDNKWYSLYDEGITGCNCVENNRGGSTGKPIRYEHDTSGITIAHREYSEIIFCRVNNSLINNVTIANNGSDGILFLYSNNNTIKNSNSSNNYDGILLRYSNTNILTNNTANSNNGMGEFDTGCGFYLHYSSGNKLIDNTANSNRYSGIDVYHSSDNILHENKMLKNKVGISLGSSSSNNTIANNQANNSLRHGLYIASSATNNRINSNTISSNSETGIYIKGDSNNITDNAVLNNTNFGISSVGSRHNLIYNNYFNNTNNAYDTGKNTWNITKTTGTNIVGGPYLGGNYWSDYNGTDTDGDKLGDTLLPYNCSGGIKNGGDYHPLIEKGVSGHKFNDSNGDGVWDPTELPLAGWTIKLEGTAEDGSIVSLTTTTDDDGFYKFVDVPKGTYTLSEVLKDGWIQTLPAPPGTYTITITNHNVKEKDFGNLKFWIREQVVVGAPFEHVKDNEEQGRAYVFSGATGKLYLHLNTSNPQSKSRFGYSTCTGNVIGDYLDEVLIGAPFENMGDDEAQGRVYVFSGATGKLQYILDAPNSQSLFGWTLSVGDINGDGLNEIVVGAPGENVGDNEGQGRVYVFSGSTGKLHTTLDTPNPQPNASFGYSVSTGDINGDGFEEIIVGAPYEKVTHEDQGRVYVFYGSTGELRSVIDTSNPRPWAVFGYSVSTGDVSGDGFDELIIGAPGEGVGDNVGQGRVYVFYGSTGELRTTLDTPNLQEGNFGWSVSTGDGNGDGLDEIIVGAPYENVRDNEAQGRVYVFYGSTGMLRHTLDTPNPQPNSWFGYSVCSGEVANDYRDEIVVGSPGENIRGEHDAGRVHVFSGETGKLHVTLNDTTYAQQEAYFGYSVSTGMTTPP